MSLQVGSSHALKLAVQLPDSTPPEQRTAAALAALEQQGFRATGGRVLKHIQRLAPVSWESLHACTPAPAAGRCRPLVLPCPLYNAGCRCLPAGGRG